LYWRDAAADEAMQDEHGFLWRAMLATVDIDLVGGRVLDIGCNRGGFLRLLVDAAGIAEGCGYDPAAAAIDDARRLTGPRPLRFAATDSPPDSWAGFDAAFSHEVLYLLHDLAAHAADAFATLAPGAPYYAAMGVHAGSPLMQDWHGSVASELALPRLYSLEEVAAVFADAGFDVSLARLPIRFVPLSATSTGHSRHSGDGDGSGSAGASRSHLTDWLDYYTQDKVLFRFARPSSR
jgi:SAM-dependent methyltransferase